MASNRFLIVEELSSAARMPLPGCTIASATLVSWSRFIRLPSFIEILSPTLARLRLFPKRLYARQRLALQPFEEGAARRRDIGEIVGDARVVERRHGVAAA